MYFFLLICPSWECSQYTRASWTERFPFWWWDRLNILGKLPRLKDIHLIFLRSASWLRLLPAAARLENDKLNCLDAYDQNFCTLIATMKSLKNLDLYIWEGGSWNGILEAIANLELLECLKLNWHSSKINPSEAGLLYLANEPVRRSLLDCEIEVDVSGCDEKQNDTLIRCFFEELGLKWWKKRDDPYWKLVSSRRARNLPISPWKNLAMAEDHSLFAARE